MALNAGVERHFCWVKDKDTVALNAGVERHFCWGFICLLAAEAAHALGLQASFVWLHGARPVMGKRGRARSRSRSPHVAAGAPGANDADAEPVTKLFGSGYHATGLVKCMAAHAREQLQELFDCGLLAHGPRWKTEGGTRPYQVILARLFGVAAVSIKRWLAEVRVEGGWQKALFSEKAQRGIGIRKKEKHTHTHTQAVLT